MATIWDAPTAAEAPTTTNYAATRSSAPGPGEVVGTEERHFGTQAGPLLTPAGRGVKNGVPYGETEKDRVEALNAQYPFAASGARRLDAATRKALGR